MTKKIVALNVTQNPSQKGWFRLPNDFAANPKIGMMSDSDQLTWIKVLCVAAECEGDIPLEDDEICQRLRISTESWGYAVAKFMAKSMISRIDGVYRITGWQESYGNLGAIAHGHGGQS